MVKKTEYEIDDRVFHVEQRDKSWAGWFADSPATVFSGSRERDVLDQAGYRPPRPAGIQIVIGSDVREYAPPQTMQDAYEEFQSRIEAGYQPQFPAERPLNKFDILGRDKCRCFLLWHYPYKVC